MLTFFLSALSIILVVTTAFVFHYRQEKIQSDTQSKLQGLVDQINDAQHYEYKFDINQDQNIKNLDTNVTNMYTSVDKLQNNVAYLQRNAALKSEMGESVSTKSVSTNDVNAKRANFADNTFKNNIIVEAGRTRDGNNEGLSAINFNGYTVNGKSEMVDPDKSRWRVLSDQRGGEDMFGVDQAKQDGSLHNYMWMSNGSVGLNNNKLRISNKWTGHPDDGVDRAEIANDVTGFKKLMIVGNRSSGENVRKVGVWDRLDVHGTEYVDKLSSAQNVQGRESVYAGDNAAWMRSSGDVHVGNNIHVQNKMFFKDPSFATAGNVPNNTDAYYLEKVVTETDNSHLRLTINDGQNESFQIWGDSCSVGNCAGPGALRHRFEASGNAWHQGSVNADSVNARSKVNVGSTEMNVNGVVGTNVRANTRLSVGSQENVWMNADGTTKVNRLQLGNKFGLSGVGDNTENDEWLRLTDPSGKAYSGGFAAGKLYSMAGGVMTGSDIRMKKDVANVSGDDINKITSLDPKQYIYKDDPKQRLQYGLIAQDVEKVYPNIVEIGANGMKSLRYQDLIPILVGKVKDLENKACVDGVCLTKEDVLKLKAM